MTLAAGASLAAPEVLAPSAATQMQSAEQSMRDGKFQEAAAAFERIVEADPTNGVAQVRQGRALLLAGEVDRALEVQKQAAANESVRSRALFNIACCFAAKKDSDRAFAALEEARVAGFTRIDIIRADPFLTALGEKARMDAIAAAIEKSFDKPEYHQLDFWVGTWDVYNRQGQRVGSNIIEKVERGFVISERWTNSIGRTGRSINFYNPVSAKMKQVWVDDTGTVLEMEGVFERGALRFAGDATGLASPSSSHRTILTPLPGGHVRQFIQSGSGATLTTTFDAIYVPSGEKLSKGDLAEFETPGDADR